MCASLLSHRSRAPLSFSDDFWEQMVARGGTPREQRRFFVDAGLRITPPTPPNTASVFSNSGYIVAGVMLETLAEQEWAGCTVLRHIGSNGFWLADHQAHGR